MIRTVVWSEDALRDLDQSIAYIAERNPVGAERVLADLQAAASGLATRSTGRPGRIAGTFEKSVSNRPYIVAYAIQRGGNSEEVVVILRVIHTARNWPRGQWPS